jgi:hypothetical protein
MRSEWLNIETSLKRFMLISKYCGPLLWRSLFVAAPAFLFSLNGFAQQAPAATRPEETLARAIATEGRLIAKLKTVQPVIETYVQQMQPDEDLGAVPKTDNYFLGKLDISREVSDDSFIPAPGFFKRSIGVFTKFFSPEFLPRGFAQMVLMDEDGFDRQHYTFQYVRREFLGDVRCLVFDVTPEKNAGKGRFLGRIWVEDRDYHIVRFNGTYGPHTMRTHYTHFDSWRVNCGPDLWLPAYVYTEEGSMPMNGGLRHVAFKAQTRLWGYQSKKERKNEEFTNMTVDTQGVNDKSEQAADNSPLEQQRLWERQAEDNILERLQDAGLVAPPGEVDKVLDTVVTNLEITNNINVQPEMRARVMLTTPLESIYVGHTIMVSRGLLDVLPDEATLAAVVAHEMGHVLLGHQLDTKYAFWDRMLFKDDKTLQRVQLTRSEREEDAADQKALEMLKKSPYADKLPKVGLFLKMLSARGDELPHLIRPLIGNRMAANSKDLRLSDLMEQAPQLEQERIDQIAALPLGARVKMDPWNDRLSLMKTHNVQLLSAREKFPFEITPFMLHLTREADQGTATPGGASSNTPPPTQNPAPAASPQQGGNPSGQEQPVQNGQPAAR